MKKQICILGSTGSIGTQALDVVREHSDLFEIYCLTANNRVEQLARQAREFRPAAVVIANDAHYDRLKELLSDLPEIKVYAGRDALDQIVEASPIDMVLTAMVGFAGLSPTIHAIRARKTICLANKETLVVAGELICRLAMEHRVRILPVDSEHSAIFQSIVGEGDNAVEKILLTASGGPFRLFSKEQMATVTAADALKHPTWEMGAKITIDSATMMNKGFEVIEARWLFGVPAEKDTGACTSAVYRPQRRAVLRRSGEGTTRSARHAPSHTVCVLLPRPATAFRRPPRPIPRTSRVLRARPRQVPLSRHSVRVNPPRRQHAVHSECRQ